MTRKASPRTDLWSQQQSARAAELWRQHFAEHFGDSRGPRGARDRVLRLIAAEIGRSFEGVAARNALRGPTFGSMLGESLRAVPAELLADRDRRRDAAARRNPAAELFNDPPPGFSALDRRGQ